MLKPFCKPIVAAPVHARRLVWQIHFGLRIDCPGDLAHGVALGPSDPGTASDSAVGNNGGKQPCPGRYTGRGTVDCNADREPKPGRRAAWNRRTTWSASAVPGRRKCSRTAFALPTTLILPPYKRYGPTTPHSTAPTPPAGRIESADDLQGRPRRHRLAFRRIMLEKLTAARRVDPGGSSTAPR